MGLSILGYFGALIAFFIGLRQYKRADYWKRAEFLAKDLKEFFNDKQVSTALILMDWGIRYVDLGVTANNATVPHRGDETLVDRELQCLALRPHTILSAAGASDSAVPISNAPNPDRAMGASLDPGVAPADSVAPEHIISADDASGGRIATSGGAAFGPEQAIRDCYDRLLDGLNRYGNYLAGSLVSVAELEPYLGYWIRDLANTQCDGDDAYWSLCLLAYIDFYAFLGVHSLFEAFDIDIAIEGSLAQNYAARSPHPAQADTLIEHVKIEKERTRAARAKKVFKRPKKPPFGDDHGCSFQNRVRSRSRPAAPRIQHAEPCRSSGCAR